MVGLEGRCLAPRLTKQKALCGSRTRIAGLGSRCLAVRLTEQMQERGSLLQKEILIESGEDSPSAGRCLTAMAEERK